MPSSRGDSASKRAKTPVGHDRLGLRNPNPVGCRYIHGDPREPGSRWCNQPTALGSSWWCPEHREKCYQRVNPDAREAA